MEYFDSVRSIENYNSFLIYLNLIRNTSILRNCQNGEAEPFAEDSDELKNQMHLCYENYFRRMKEAELIYMNKHNEQELI